jgi:hypothetical protein
LPTPQESYTVRKEIYFREAVMPQVRAVTVPEQVRALSGLDRVGYADAFEVETTVSYSPHDWALLATDEASPLVRGFVDRAHRALGLRLAPPGTPDHVLGWQIRHDGPEATVLAAAGGLGTGRIVITTAPGRLLFATLLRFGGIGGRVAWVGVAPMHRAVARYLVGNAARVAADRHDVATAT